MKILICGGGTAGHIYPGVALAEALKSLEPQARILFVGSKNGLENEVVPAAGYELLPLAVQGFERRATLKNVGRLALLAGSLVGAWRLLRRERPTVVVGMGGYASFPVLVAATLAGYPTVIHEQNVVPGLANRLLASRVDAVVAAYEASRDYFRRAREVSVVGNPVRAEVLAANREEALARLGLDPKRLTLLVFGGSRGAEKINQAVLEAYPLFRHLGNLQVVHVTGMIGYETITGRLAKLRVAHDKVEYTCYPYLEDMPSAYAAADLVLSRAGASTLAELTARGLPSILVPYPHATNDHQAKNARALEVLGAARVIPNENLTGPLLWEALDVLIHRPSSLKTMGRKSAATGRPRAALDLAELVLSRARQTSHGALFTDKDAGFEGKKSGPS